jgi:hypothetical protein
MLVSTAQRGHLTKRGKRGLFCQERKVSNHRIRLSPEAQTAKVET